MTASASAPETFVQNFIKLIKKNYQIKIHEEEYKNENVFFKMWASKIEKGGVLVNVVEVRNPKPIDPDRSEANEANIHKPLRFGSRTSITTAGNWE